jgi:anaerobic selenocysteine-containing dehydrogenase
MAETRHSVCALDCPDACGLVLKIEDGRATRIQGTPGHPVTQGFLCGKVARYLEREYSPQRLSTPLRRIGAKGEGRFEPISWDEALTTITQRFQSIIATHGAEAILPYSYGGSMGLLQANGMDRRFFHRLGASRLDRTICASAGTAGLTATQGVRYGVEPEAFVHSKLIIAWGANILTTNVHLWPFIVEARRRGARFIVIDPVRTKTASLADQHLRINPGSDLALALGLMHLLFANGHHNQDYLTAHANGWAELRETVKAYTPAKVAAWTGIPEADIIALAQAYGETHPSVIRLNYGVQRSERGGTAVRAIAMLPVVTGAWRHIGGGLQLSTSQAFNFNRVALEMPELQPGPTRLLNMSELGSALTRVDNPPVKSLFVYCSNPAAVAPDQSAVLAGLRREDLFTVVVEQFQTDTADYADLVLPTTTFLEHTDIYGAYGHHYVQLARPALPPPGEARSNVQIFRELAHRMGFTDAAFTESEDDMIRGILSSGHPHLAGITLERLDQEHSIRLNLGDGPFQPFKEGGFGHPDGKADLRPEGLDYVPPIESRHGDAALRSRYPLEFLSPKNHDSMNSTFGNRADVDAQTALVYLNSADAAARGIATGDSVRVFNGRASLVLRAEVDGVVGPGTVSSPSLRWPKRQPGGLNINALVSERLTDIGAGATFYSCLVQVEKCGD